MAINPLTMRSIFEAYRGDSLGDTLEAIAEVIGLSPRYALVGANTEVNQEGATLTLEIRLSRLDLFEISEAMKSNCEKSIEAGSSAASISSIASSLMKGYSSTAIKAA